MNAEELAKILDELGERLGPTGEYVFGLAVRQVYINAVTAVVLLSIFVGIGVVFGPRLYRWQKSKEDDHYSDRGFVVGMAAIAYTVAGAFVVFVSVTSVAAVLNPEYTALRDLLRTIR